MKIECIETQRTDIPPHQIEYLEYMCPGSPPGRPFKLRTPLMQFKVKIEGKRYVDGQYVCDYVQYK